MHWHFFRYGSSRRSIPSILPGDHIILGDDLYGGSIRMFTNIYEQNGIEFTYVGTSDLDAVKAAFRPNTKAVYIETPTNPMMEITDIRALCIGA